MKHRKLAVLLAGALLAAVAIGTSGSQGASTEPPGVVSFFELTVDGARLAVFSQLEGIVSGIDVADLELTSRSDVTSLKLPPTRKPPAVTLTRGLTGGLELAAWHEQAMTDVQAARKTATLTMYDQTATPVARWTLENAWPTKYHVSPAAGSGSIVLETVTIVCEKLERRAV